MKILKAPNTYLIISFLLLFTAALTWILPGGAYQRTELNGREVVVPGTYTPMEKKTQNIDAVFIAPLKGFEDASLIIVFVLVVGGAFAVFQKTEAIDRAIHKIAHLHEKSPTLRSLMIPLLMIVFSAAGATFGMSEEVIPFIPIFVTLAIRLGYDTFTGISIPFIGAGVGFAGAMLNPFTVGIAQGISGIPLFSGIEYRIFVWIASTIVAVLFVMHHARRVQKNPALSPTYQLDLERRKNLPAADTAQTLEFSKRHYAVMAAFLSAIILIIVGVLQFGWYIYEIAAVFIVAGIVVGLIARISADEIVQLFITGARDLIGTALIIGLARGILILAQDGNIIDTMLYYLTAGAADFHPILSSQLMFGVHMLINFFVPSGSGQAALTMPVMAPLADLLHISRQTAVLAFQFGDGFGNMIIPTSAVTMSVMSVAGVQWKTWAKWILTLEIIFFILGCLLLIPPYFINWQ